MDSLTAVAAEVAACRACPRLVAWREEVARVRRAAFRDEEYWGRGVPGFGDPEAGVLLVGLAPAAHGANRTGRMFTGDRSGDFLYGSLHRVGLASQPTSDHVDDGLVLRGAYITAAVRCAPPGNQPLPEERDRCHGYLEREWALLDRVRVVVALGGFAYQAVAPLLGAPAPATLRPRAGGAAGGGAHVAVHLPPQPAEHVHRPAHRAHARRRAGPGRRPGGRRGLRSWAVSGRSSAGSARPAWCARRR